MTAAQLIELLQLYPGDLPVLVHSEGDHQYGEALRVERSTDEDGDLLTVVGE